MILLYLLLQLINYLDAGVLENPCGTMTPRGNDEDWGIGAFYIPNTFEIDLYKDTLGTEGLKIITPRETMEFYDKSTRLWIEYFDLEWIGNYNNELLKVKQSGSPNYFIVLWKHQKGGYYVSKEELVKKGAKFYSYKELLFDTTIEMNGRQYIDWAHIGVNLNKNCLRLRKQPDINSEIVTCVRGNDWGDMKETHMEILKSKGNWAYVEVTSLTYADERDDCPSILENKWEGWLKAVDENGFPNIWYSVSSY